LTARRLVEDEDLRAARLLGAQAKAAGLFAAIGPAGIIAPGSGRPMRRRDRNGQICHWILEVHLVDTECQIGGFFEELLDLGPGPAAAGWPG
jgi:hypothetical protein